ncbi:MAG: methyltransferase type 11 [Balneola sp.]|jgi:SAM-dependent methyltransferase|nr:methyltransferase type 11 [Balneola sp.]MBE80720.1 methyltransferase type 11 [Balneola sp.]|tara:strand:+ start:16415 stop:17455 length:1041 start_codon:yes stop_codon:yes gene_type:complete
MTNSVQEYYGKVLKSTNDLKTTACCTTENIPDYHKKILADIEDEVLAKFYGCGSPIPSELEGKVVLDLGCGSGRDVYLASKLVGPDGHVIGVDMTEEQLDVANRNLDKQMKKFGFEKPNVEFKNGYIEDLKAIGIEDNSVDVVISNCVINLSPDKRRVYEEIFRVLKPGGELYFSDVFSDRRVPQHLVDDPVLFGECLSGALYIEDFRRMLRDVGCLDYRVVTGHKIDIENAEIEQKVGMVNFESLTIRAFKLDAVEDICEDYGQVATYQGTIPESPHAFMLDDHHLFETGKPMLVCGNTAAMVEETRYGKHFKVTGNRNTHFGAFDCEPSSSPSSSEDSAMGACC